MVGETLKMERHEAFTVYGWLTSSVVISQIIGALLGDLLIGNKKSVIIGGIIQAIGAFCLCVGSKSGLYLGLFLIVFGNGLYTPNIISNFGKSYLNKTKLLDSGFTILYFATNLGAFLGVLLIGYFGDSFGFSIGFTVSGVLMLLSIVPILISKEQIEEVKDKCKFSIGNKVLNILIAPIVVSVFWAIYEIVNIRIYDLQIQFSEIITIGISKSMWQSFSTAFILPLGLLVSILWTYFYSNQYFKLFVGFVFGIISLGLLFLIPKVPTAQHTILCLLSLFLLGVAEIHVAPIIHSIVTKYSNPKYLAIIISLAYIPTRLFSALIGVFSERFYDNPILGVKYGLFTMVFIGVALLGYVLLKKRTTYNKLE